MHAIASEALYYWNIKYIGSVVATLPSSTPIFSWQWWPVQHSASLRILFLDPHQLKLLQHYCQTLHSQYHHQLHSAPGITKGLSINVQDLISEENIRFRILSPTMITCENITLTPPPTQWYLLSVKLDRNEVTTFMIFWNIL